MMGLVEDRLSTTLAQLQQDILATPSGQVDVEQLVRERITALANRITNSLSALS